TGPETGLTILRARKRRALGSEELVEEVLEEGIVAPWRQARFASHLRSLDRPEMHDGGADVLDDSDEALLQCLGERRRRGDDHRRANQAPQTDHARDSRKPRRQERGSPARQREKEGVS